MKKLSEKIEKRATTFTFGFGKDHDGNMLRAISEEGQGMYYFLEKKDDIPKSFADCLGGLLSVVSQNITLTLETKNGVKLEKYLSNFKNKVINDNKIQINIGDMLSEEKRDILFKLKIPKTDEEKELEFCTISLSYMNVVEMNNESIEINPTIKIVKTFTENYTISIELDKQNNRYLTTQSLEQARNLADKGNLEEARKVLTKAIESIEKSASKDLEFCQNLIEDLKSCMGSMKDVEKYHDYGNKLMNNMWQTNVTQRSTNSSILKSSECNDTKKKKAMRSKFE
jgi:hypothetical protein